MLREQVELVPEAERILEAYWEIDRNDWRRPLFSSAVDVLDEYGWIERSERRLIRRLWRAMAETEADVRKKKRAAEKKRQKDADREGKQRRRAMGIEEDDE